MTLLNALPEQSVMPQNPMDILRTRFGSDFLGGVNYIDLQLYELDANTLSLENLAGGIFKDLKLGKLIVADGITTPNTDSNYFAFYARDNDAATVEVAAVLGAADPYVRIGRDDTGVATNAVTDMLVLQAGAGANNEAQNFGCGISIKLGNAASEVEERISIDAVLSTATNGSETSCLNFNIMNGGTLRTSVLTLDAFQIKGSALRLIMGDGEGDMSIKPNGWTGDSTARDFNIQVLDTTGDDYRTILQVQGGAGVTAATAKLGFHGAAPVSQAAHIANGSDAATTQAAVNAVLVVLENLGFIATS